MSGEQDENLWGSVSEAASGAVSKWSLDAMFLIAWGRTLLVTVWTVLQPSLRRFADRLAAGEPAPEEV
jgi:hypothetical protein